MIYPTPIHQAIAIAGSEAKLAALINRSQVAVNKAKQRGRVSAEMAVLIERAVGVGRHLLRPDLFRVPEAPLPHDEPTPQHPTDATT